MFTKRTILSRVPLLMVAVIVMVVSCGHDTSDPAQDNDLSTLTASIWGDPTGGIIGYGYCKQAWMTSLLDDVALYQTGVVWEYDGQGTLYLHHINAAFNCCPEEITGEMIFGERTITIVEGESYGEMGPCLCLCLVDVDFCVTNLAPGKYTIHIDELRPGIEDEIEFEAVMKGCGSSGTFVLDRCSCYPWAECP